MIAASGGGLRIDAHKKTVSNLKTIAATMHKQAILIVFGTELLTVADIKSIAASAGGSVLFE